MPEWGIAEPSPPYLQISYSTDNLLLKLGNLHPSLATRNAPGPVPMFSVDSGVWHLSAHCSELCAEGTTKASNHSVSPLGVMFTYSIPLLMVKLFLMRYSTLPSSESECSPMHVLSKTSLFWGGSSFLVLIHLWQAANSTSSPFASSQLVMCIGANLKVRACASSSRLSHSTLRGQLISCLCYAHYCSFQER